MDDLINKIAAKEESLIDAAEEVRRVLDEIKVKAQKHNYLKNKLFKWTESGDNQYHQWNLEIGIFLIRFDLNDVINNIETEQDESGFPVPNEKIEVDKIENAVKKVISSKVEVS